MKDNYTYPVVFDYSEADLVNFIIPDLNGAVSSAELGDDIIKEAQDFLAMTILDYMDSGKALPGPSLEIEAKNNEKVIFINVWMPYHRSTVKEVLVKKTLTIPSWLDVLGRQANINFSAVLVKGLKEKLDLR